MLATLWPPEAPEVDPITIQNGFQNRSQNEANTNMDNISENQEIMIRMQGAKTSKTMLPCERRVHLHKSASFKMMFETF